MAFRLSFGDAFPVHAVHLWSRRLGAEAPQPARLKMNFLSWGSQRSPLYRSKQSRPLQAGSPKRVCSRCEAARPHMRAALAVSHDLDGLLRDTPCRFIAPCCRLWGSPRFRVLPCPRSLQAAVGFSAPPFPSGALPFEVFPSTTARIASPRPYSLSLFQLTLGPLARRKRRARVPSESQPTSGPCSVVESVVSVPTLPPVHRPILPWA